MEIPEVYAQLMERLHFPKSEYLPRILDKIVSPDDARLLLDLPAGVSELAAKHGMDEETIAGKLQEFMAKGLAISGSKGPRLARDITQFHDSNISSADQWVDEELLDLWRDFYEAEWLPTMSTVPKDSYVNYIRVLPAWAAIEQSPHISKEDTLPGENVRELIKGTRLIAVIPCSCRKSMRRCDAPVNNCLQFDKGAEYAIKRGAGREISAEEAIALADEAAEAGLVHTWPFGMSPVLHELCNCCHDCCGIFDACLRFGTIDQVVEKTRYRPQLDQTLCSGCQDCVERCCFEAIEMEKVPSSRKLKAVINLDKCFGCAVCAVGCETTAITMKLATA